MTQKATKGQGIAEIGKFGIFCRILPYPEPSGVSIRHMTRNQGRAGKTSPESADNPALPESPAKFLVFRHGSQRPLLHGATPQCG